MAGREAAGGALLGGARRESQPPKNDEKKKLTPKIKRKSPEPTARRRKRAGEEQSGANKTNSNKTPFPRTGGRKKHPTLHKTFSGSEQPSLPPHAQSAIRGAGQHRPPTRPRRAGAGFGLRAHSARCVVLDPRFRAVCPKKYTLTYAYTPLNCTLDFENHFSPSPSKNTAQGRGACCHRDFQTFERNARGNSWLLEAGLFSWKRFLRKCVFFPDK